MTNDIEIFVRLKYPKIDPKEYLEWHYMKEYPLEVRKNWVWRCASELSIHPLRNNDIETILKSIEVYRKYFNGEVTVDERDEAWIKTDMNVGDSAAYWACCGDLTAAMHRCEFDVENLKFYAQVFMDELCKFESKESS